MTGSWSTKRRIIIGGVFIVIVAILAGLFYWRALYIAPTCSDGRKNGDETGVDCGGSCKNLCTSDTLNPVVLWSKIFNISGDVYTLVAYVENPNLGSKNLGAKYQFSVYDSQGKIVTVKEGVTTIPRGKKFSVFETGLILKGAKPKSTDFKFISFGPWEKDNSVDPEVSIKYSGLLSTSTVPRVTGTISNNSLQNIPGLELSVFVLDSNENVIAASNTFVDNLIKRTSQDFVFTWPKPFNLGVEECASPVDVVVALDRSGSMKSEGVNPPEPFTTVGKTAKEFIKNLNDQDQVAVVSFGTESNKEGDLSLNKEVAISAVSNLFLSTTTLEQTNITGGLTDAYDELKSERGRSDARKAIILLTDGIPTMPTKVGDSKYPATSAQQVASDIKSAGVTIYTIGLGKDVDSAFLKSISLDDDHYFFAPSKETLSSVYNKIVSNLCVKKPSVINIIYRPTK
jgi:hypothetical protein